MSIPKHKRRVKRAYSSPLRADHARATRRVIVEAAQREFAARGYGAVSIEDIARAAGVSRATVFSVGGKGVLLREAYYLAFAQAAGGDDDRPLVQRPRSVEIRAAKTARDYLAGYAALAADISIRLAPIHEAVRAAAQADLEVAALWQGTTSERRRGCGTIVADVCARAPLRDGLDEVTAADVVYLLNDPSTCYQLVYVCGWPPAKFAAWLAGVLQRELLGAG